VADLGEALFMYKKTCRIRRFSHASPLRKARMKTVSIILPLLIVSFIVLPFIYRGISRAGETPGLVEGILPKCPNKRNCFCSEYKNDVDHYIDPIIIPQNSTVDTFSLLKDVIRQMGGNIQVESRNYLAATFTSAIFKFVDDLQVRIDSTQEVIHIRSASRVGFSDLGVNKKRLELLKKLFTSEVSEANRSLDTTPKNGAH
jgi:uncharacterized protein (DUF1499 family)